MNRIIGYTAGAFDLLHIGHINLLKSSKKYCDYLIVGVTTDELVRKTKSKTPISNLKERMEIVESIKFVDQVVIQDDLDKVVAWRKFRYDILFSGDDWKGVPRWNMYEFELAKKGVKVIYLPYTKSISSTMLQKFIKEANQG